MSTAAVLRMMKCCDGNMKIILMHIYINTDSKETDWYHFIIRNSTKNKTVNPNLQEELVIRVEST